MRKLWILHCLPAGLAGLLLIVNPAAAQVEPAQAKPPPQPIVTSDDEVAPTPRKERTPPPVPLPRPVPNKPVPVPVPVPLPTPVDPLAPTIDPLDPAVTTDPTPNIPRKAPRTPPVPDPREGRPPTPSAPEPGPRRDQPERPSTGSADGGTIETAPAVGQRVRDLLGTGVAIQKGQTVGKIYDMILNSGGMVEYVIVEDAGQLRSVPWKAVSIEAAGRDAVRAVTIRGITEERFRTVPGFTRDRYPNFLDSNYRSETTRYYNLRPTDPDYLDRGVLSGATRDGVPAGVRPPEVPADRTDDLPVKPVIVPKPPAGD